MFVTATSAVCNILETFLINSPTISHLLIMYLLINMMEIWKQCLYYSARWQTWFTV